MISEALRASAHVVDRDALGTPPPLCSDLLWDRPGMCPSLPEPRRAQPDLGQASLLLSLAPSCLTRGEKPAIWDDSVRSSNFSALKTHSNKTKIERNVRLLALDPAGFRAALQSCAGPRHARLGPACRWLLRWVGDAGIRPALCPSAAEGTHAALPSPRRASLLRTGSRAVGSGAPPPVRVTPTREGGGPPRVSSGQSWTAVQQTRQPGSRDVVLSVPRPRFQHSL